MNAMFFSKELSEKQIIKLKKKINKKYKDIEMIVIEKNLKKNSEFMENIKLLNIPIVDGRWLFKLLVVQVIEYISKYKGRKLEDLEISFMTNNYNELVEYYIKELINRVKSLKIITNERWKFAEIEKKLFKEEGNVLIITSNKRKALKNIDIVINFDFTLEEMNSFNFYNKIIIINLKEKIDIKTKRFQGINISSYEIEFYNKGIDIYNWTKKFDNIDIYESYLYRNERVNNLIETIKKDSIMIKNLIGNNGKISAKEYKNT